jgi:hypothetical protein
MGTDLRVSLLFKQRLYRISLVVAVFEQQTAARF